MALWKEVKEYVETTEVRGGKINLPCLACERRTSKRDRKHALYVNRVAGFFHCFRCGIAGRIGDICRAVPDLHSIRPTTVPSVVEKPEGFVEIGRDPGLSALCMQEARDYAKQRHIGLELARQFSVGAVISGYYENRLIVPITSGEHPEEPWFGYVARDYTGRAERPYLYPRGMSRGSAIFNHSQLLEVTDIPLLVVEGVLDAFPLYPDGVAVLGMPSGIQYEALMESPRSVVWVLDGDAWEKAEGLAWKMRFQGKRSGFVRLPPKKDPDEMDRGWLREEAILSLERTI